MAGGIFISYRRDDTRQAAGRLADDLAGRFGTDNIFRDIEGIDPGVEFAKALNKALGSCVVMLVLIGAKWLDIRDAQGQRRLDDTGDWIAQEIDVALKREIRVVPVLIDGAKLPETHELPERLRPLVGRQCLELDDGRWRGDLARLVETLSRIPELRVVGPAPAPPAAPAPAPAKKWNWKLIGYVTLGFLVVGGIANYQDTQNARPDNGLGGARTEPNLVGTWYSPPAIGITFYITQNANGVALNGNYRGAVVGGTAYWQGTTLVAELHLPVVNAGIQPVQCKLQVSPDGGTLQGDCVAPQTRFPFAITRG